MYKKIVLIGIINIFLLSSLTTLSATEIKNFSDSESLNVGDLLFGDINTEVLTYMWELSPGYSNDHIAMYLGNDKFIHAIPYLPFVPLSSGVCIWTLSEIEK